MNPRLVLSVRSPVFCATMATKKAAVSIYDRSLIQTTALRDYVPKDMRALFDHLISLAKHSHSVGYPARAGRELLHARKLAKKPD